MELLSISPIDGRYTRCTNELRYYFSEYSFIKYRLFIEIEYLITLGLYELYSIELETIPFLRDIHETFDIDECKIVKEIENTTKHDVKSIEYYIRDKIIERYGKDVPILQFIHFGLTSQDVNSSANILMIKESLEEVLIPKMNDILHCMKSLSSKWISIPLLARTHGQPATPTTLGKEISVFYERLYKQMTILKSIKYTTKFGGAQVFIKPASNGTGIKAGGAMRAVLESVGVKDVLAKSKGSSNPHNLVKATLKALLELRDAREIALQRGISLNKVFQG